MSPHLTAEYDQIRMQAMVSIDELLVAYHRGIRDGISTTDLFGYQLAAMARHGLTMEELSIYVAFLVERLAQHEGFQR